ncbi:MAG: cytoplasmic protein [Desulfobacterales bacterium]|jgi:hypothetical protein|nr:cytoplasmic protein [Desulfobacterales bacterium]
MNEEPQNGIEFKIDRSELYHQETFTDLKGGTVTRFTPVQADGSPDKGRRTVYLGQATLYTPNGPVPLQTPIQAKDLPQALKRFPEAMQEALANLVEEARAMQRQEQPPIIQAAEPRIIVP